MERASYRKSNEFFTFHNENPKGRLTVGDCSIRALGYASEKGWDYAYMRLCKIAWEMKATPIDDCVCEEFLRQEGFEKFKQIRKPDKKKYMIREIAKILKDKGRVVVRTSNHWTVVESGMVIDTWDCGTKCAGNYWIKE